MILCLYVYTAHIDNHQFELRSLFFKKMKTLMIRYGFRTFNSHVKGPMTPSLTDLNIPLMLRKTTEIHANREAAVFRYSNHRFSFQQLENASNNIAAGFIASGLKPGDRLGVWSHNRPEWLLTQYAAAKAGLILVNVNPSYRPIELAYAIDKCQIKGIISDTEWGKQNYVTVLSEALKIKQYESLKFISFIGHDFPGAMVDSIGGQIREAFI